MTAECDSFPREFCLTQTATIIKINALSNENASEKYRTLDCPTATVAMFCQSFPVGSKTEQCFCEAEFTLRPNLPFSGRNSGKSALLFRNLPAPKTVCTRETRPIPHKNPTGRKRQTKPASAGGSALRFIDVPRTYFTQSGCLTVTFQQQNHGFCVFDYSVAHHSECFGGRIPFRGKELVRVGMTLPAAHALRPEKIQPRLPAGSSRISSPYG